MSTPPHQHQAEFAGAKHQSSARKHQALLPEHQAPPREHQAPPREHQAPQQEHQPLQPDHQPLQPDHQPLQPEHQATQEHQAAQEHQADPETLQEHPAAPRNHPRAADPLSPEEFTGRLRALSTRYWDRHPFHLRLHAGELSKDELQLWAANRWYYQRCIPRKDAAILANCPDPDVRRQWRERIIWHDGERAGEGGAENWLRMAEALGLSREEVLDERHVLPGTRFAVDAYVNFARNRPWVEGVASGLTEMFSRGLMTRRLADMRARYPWIAEEGFAYFTSRLKVVEGEGKSTLDVVVRNCATREQQDAAVAALAFKCDVLRAILDAVDYHALGRTDDRTAGRR